MLCFHLVPRILREASSEMQNEHQPVGPVNPAAGVWSPLRIFGRLVTSLLVIALTSAPASARVVTVEGASTLTDASEASVNRALDQAIANCLKTAESMGLSWVKLGRVMVKGDQVVVEMLASDDEEDTQRDTSSSESRQAE
jgi:hypothetical protein